MRLMSLGGSRAGGHKTEVPMGGNITIQGNVVTHDYISNANLSVPVTFSGNLLLVGGGGGGGTGIGGGGGAGGLVFNPNEVIPRSYYNVNVGVGGSGATSTAQSGAVGGNTSLKFASKAQVTINAPVNFDVGGLKIAIWNPVNGYTTNNDGSVIVNQDRIFVNELLLIGGGSGGGLTSADPNSKGYGGAPGTIFYSNNFYLDPGTYTVKVGTGGFGAYSINYYDGVSTTGRAVPTQGTSSTKFGNFITPPTTSTGAFVPTFNTTPRANVGSNGTSIYTDLLKLVNQYLPANQAIGKLVNGKYYVAAGGGGAQVALGGTGGTGGIGGGGNGDTISGGTNIPATNGSSPGSGGGGNNTKFLPPPFISSANNPGVTINQALAIPGLGANGIAIMTYFTSGDVFVAYGGGGGASSGSAASAIGGSGGGGNGASNNISPGGKAYVTQGNDGGLGLGVSAGVGVAGGGGGSLGYTTSVNVRTSGGNGTPLIPISGGGSGGQPTPIKIPTNEVVYYAGGGGGSGGGGAGGGTGGDGNESGGAGGTGSVGQAGVDNTGGGGGGTGSSDISGANRGGSGRAAVKYLTWANQGLRNSLYTCRDVNEVNDGNWHTLYFDKKTEFSLHQPINAAEILIVAAGGTGSTYGAGGGGGGVVYIPEYTLPAASYEIKVGQPNSLWSDDGFGIPNQTAGSLYQASVSGGNSFIRTRTLDINLVAVGGGAGAYASSATPPSNFPLNQGGVPGGSAGGGANLGKDYNRPLAVSGIQKTLPGDSGKYGYGNAGGDANIGTSSYVGGGGGGAGSAGAGPNSTSNGGDGLLLTITGAPAYYSAGGRGIAFNGTSVNGSGWGGPGSGGQGGNYSTAGQNNAKGGIVIVKFNTSNRVMGGRMSSLGPYTLHTFKDVGIHGFENLLDIVADILIVGGGGGGGAGAGGGGGAGGYIYRKNVTMPADYYQIQVGNGGLGGNPSSPGNTFNGNNGGDSYISGNFLTLNASGGGGGVGATGSNSGVQGGSGGGSSVNATRQVLSPGIGNGSQGFAGGAGKNMSDIAATGLNFIVSGGGGGAAQAGSAGVGVINTGNLTFISPVPVPGAGGSGLSNDITGTATYYAGGGGGGGSILMIPASGPAPAVPSYPRAIVGGAGTYTTGGGGPGYNITTYNYVRGLEPTTPVLDGLANTGGGGGGGFSKVNYTTLDITNEKAGGKGGSGIVIIRYLSASIPLGNA